MFMSVMTDVADVTDVTDVAIYPELAGARVLITGLSATHGVDVARAFAEHRARLLIQTAEESPEMTEIGAVLAQNAMEIAFHTEPFRTGEDAFRFAQGPAQAFGSLDAVINLVSVSRETLLAAEKTTDIEALVSRELLAPTLITRVAANRMRLTLTPGLILNVIVAPSPSSAAEAALLQVLRAALASITRSEAQHWADQNIRINAAGPADGQSTLPARANSEPELAALALMLASNRGCQLSGLVFETAPVRVRC